MKKAIALLLTVMMVIAMAACGNRNGGNPASHSTIGEPKISAKVDGPRMVQVGGELYIDTGERITLLRCGVMDGEIAETVAPNEVPAEDDCSNFGTGYSYQIAGVYSIDVVINGDWCRFQREVPSCSYAEEMSALGLALAADPTAAEIQSDGFICTGEEAAPDVETAIWLALQETGGDCNAADAAFDEAAGLWRIHLTGEDGETTVWLGEDGVTRQVVDQPAKRIVYNGGENNEPSYKS